MLKALCYIFKTEVNLLLRRSLEWIYPLAFFIIVISLFPLALSPDPTFLKKFIPGCIWIAALLANFLATENIFTRDLEDGNLEQALLSPIPLSYIMLAKVSAQWFVTQLPLILLTPLLGLIFQLSSFATLVLATTLLIGTPIITLLGTVIVVLSLGLRQQGVLLGMLLLPLTVPVLIFAVNIVQQAQNGISIVAPLAFLAGLLLISFSLLPFAIAMTLRIAFDD